VTGSNEEDKAEETFSPNGLTEDQKEIFSPSGDGDEEAPGFQK